MPEGWERRARHEGGTVIALAAASDGDDGLSLFAATVTGLFVSTDGVRRWVAASETPLPLLAAVAPSPRFAADQTLYAGTQTGMYRSTDAGRTWRQTLSGGRILAVAVALGEGGQEHVFVGTERDDILRSEDGGRTWAGANPGLLDLTVLALAFSPDFARDGTGFAATASALYRTRNGGKAWREVALPLDEQAVQCVALSAAFATDRCVLAGTEDAGLWRSDDGGTTWEIVTGLPPGGIGAIAFSAANPRRVAVATDGGVALSNDGGATWLMTGQTLPPALTLAFVPNGAGETLVAGCYRAGIGRLALDNEGAQWVTSNAGLTATFLTGLVASPTFALDRTLFAFGPEAGIRVSRDGGGTWADAGTIGDDAPVHGLAITPHADGIRVFAATEAGIIRSRDGGTSWDMPPTSAQTPTAMIATGTTVQGEPLLLAAARDVQLIASGDGGDTWHPRATPFAGEAIVALSGTDAGVWHVGTLRPGTGDATLWRSTDGGVTWARWLEAETGGALPLAVPTGDAADDGAVFVGLGARVAQPRRNAWHLRDGARAPLWSDTTLTTGDGGPVAITALAASPAFATDGTLYAATNAGVYHSRDRGRTFAPWGDGLTPPPILALAATRDAHGIHIFALGVDGTILHRSGDA